MVGQTVLDPLGLTGFWSKIWDDITKPRDIQNVVQNFVVSICNGAKEAAANTKEVIKRRKEKTVNANKEEFKKAENGALRMESVLNAGSTSKQSEKNLSYNSEIDIKNQIIPYQREAPYSTSMAELIYIFEASGAVIGGSLIGGAFGSNPYSLPKEFDQLGLGYETVSIDEMGENGVYIILY